MSLQDDQHQRLKDSSHEVEVFRILYNRLPNWEGDEFTKKTAKEFIDRFIFGAEKLESKMFNLDDLKDFVFNAYASTNLAYKNDTMSLKQSLR